MIQEHMLYVCFRFYKYSTEQNKAPVITEFVLLVSFIVAKWYVFKIFKRLNLLIIEY